MARTVRLTAEEFQKKHRARTNAAQQDMRDGINRVTEAPGKKAAAAKDKMRQRLIESIDNGKWERRVAAVSLEDWKADMLDKGVGRVAAGLDRSAGKVVAFAEKLISHQNRLLADLEGDPSVTLEDNINRMVKWVRGMAELEV